MEETIGKIWYEILEKRYLEPPKISKKEHSQSILKQIEIPPFYWCIGQKYVFVLPSTKSESLFLNYKRSFNIVLLAFTMPPINFTVVDIGEAPIMFTLIILHYIDIFTCLHYCFHQCLL